MFITFEGIDGSGKSTVLKEVAKWIATKYPHISFITTREPGGANLKEAEAIRSIILDPQNNISPMTEAILFAASRRLHLEKIIWPALASNKIVICDRYIDSSLAYQGGASNLGLDKIAALNDLISDKTYPDLTLFFVLDPHESRNRLNLSGQSNDRIEEKSLTFFKKVDYTYHQLAQQYPQRYVLVDAAASMGHVLTQVCAILEERVFKNESKFT